MIPPTNNCYVLCFICTVS